MEDSYRQSHLFHRVAFVEVKPPFHKGDVDFAAGSDYQLSIMTLDRRTNKVRYLVVWDLDSVLDGISDAAKSRAKHDGYTRLPGL